MTANGFIRRGPMAADVFEQRFTRIYNDLFRDPRMSFKAKGIFGLISTHRDGYGLSIEAIASYATDGGAAIRTGLNELEELGYLVRTQQRLDGPTKERPNAKKGAFGLVEYFITDMPDGLLISVPAPADGTPQNPSSAPSCGNRTTDEAEENRRSAPSYDFPQTEDPQTEDRPHKKTNSKKTISLSAGPGLSQQGGRGSERETDAARNTDPATAPAQEASAPAPAPVRQEDADLVLNAYVNALSPVRPLPAVLNRLRREAKELLALGWPVDHIAKLADQLPRLGYASLAKHAEFHPPSVARTGARKTSPTACERHPAFEAGDCLRCAAEERERQHRQPSAPATIDGAGLLARLRAGQPVG
ncbi:MULTISPECIES: hypothetical protein [unclassified Streptomyces]|uniref:hypothetical protein n=1 Tax=unclassified Streptomyces TaxID=2593676 RepID=UPI0033AFC883